MFTIRNHTYRWGRVALGLAAGAAVAGLVTGGVASASSPASAAHSARTAAIPGTGAGGRAGQQPLIAPAAPKTISPDTLSGYSSVYYQFDSQPGQDWAYVNCPAGESVLGGGPQAVVPANNWNIVTNTSYNIGTGWYVTFTNTTNTTVSIWVDAVCD